MNLAIESLRPAVREDIAEEQHPVNDRLLQGRIHVEEGSFLGRSLVQYRDILCHNGAPDIFPLLQSLPSESIVIDVGCGAGVALSQMRALHPTIRLIGVDTRSVTENFNSIKRTRVEDIFEANKIEFIKASQRNMHRLSDIRGKVSLITCVGSSYDHNSLGAFLLPFTLRRFGKALSPDGLALVFISTTRDLFNHTSEVLNKYNIHHTFHPAKKDVLRRNAFSDNNEITGTLVVGRNK